MHTTSFEQCARSDRGAILVHVSLIMLVVLGLTAFVADSGVLWLGRRQAQNAHPMIQGCVRMNAMNEVGL
jgi:Flp pilus assembly protein TadG